MEAIKFQSEISYIYCVLENVFSFYLHVDDHKSGALSHNPPSHPAATSPSIFERLLVVPFFLRHSLAYSFNFSFTD